MFDRRAYDRERKRRLSLDPAFREKERQRNRARDAKRRDEVNAMKREFWASSDEYRIRQNKRRCERAKLAPPKPEDVLIAQRAHFLRHKDDASWRMRRDTNRVRLDYGLTDEPLIHALALVRAAKRKLASAKSS